MFTFPPHTVTPQQQPHAITDLKAFPCIKGTFLPFDFSVLLQTNTINADQITTVYDSILYGWLWFRRQSSRPWAGHRSPSGLDQLQQFPHWCVICEQIGRWEVYKCTPSLDDINTHYIKDWLKLVKHKCFCYYVHVVKTKEENLLHNNFTILISPIKPEQMKIKRLVTASEGRTTPDADRDVVGPSAAEEEESRRSRTWWYCKHWVSCCFCSLSVQSLLFILTGSFLVYFSEFLLILSTGPSSFVFFFSFFHKKPYYTDYKNQ